MTITNFQSIKLFDFLAKRKILCLFPYHISAFRFGAHSSLRPGGGPFLDRTTPQDTGHGPLGIICWSTAALVVIFSTQAHVTLYSWERLATESRTGN